MEGDRGADGGGGDGAVFMAPDAALGRRPGLVEGLAFGGRAGLWCVAIPSKSCCVAFFLIVLRYIDEL